MPQCTTARDAGVDTLADDPEAAPAGGFQLRLGDFAEMGVLIRSAGLPTLVVQEGGYNLELGAAAAVEVVLARSCAVVFPAPGDAEDKQ